MGPRKPTPPDDWLMPATETESFAIIFSRDDDFEQIVETIRPLALNGILGGVPQFRHVAMELALTGKQKKHFYSGSGPIPREG
ncbi:hypothetical protein RUND412_007869 [Rhizina undulata]